MPANDLGLDYGPQPEHLTRREQFAMAAMQGLLAGPLVYKPSLVAMAEEAVECADALIAELSKFNKKPV